MAAHKEAVRCARKFMEESNEFSRATAYAYQTFRRLEKAGCSTEQAKRLVTEVINAEEAAMKKHVRPFDETRIIQQLRNLPTQDQN
ncbi:MAG TPA: hypothetical protein VGI88_01855 [Verrucomicrobiae bacterium]